MAGFYLDFKLWPHSKTPYEALKGGEGYPFNGVRPPGRLGDSKDWAEQSTSSRASKSGQVLYSIWSRIALEVPTPKLGLDQRAVTYSQNNWLSGPGNAKLLWAVVVTARLVNETSKLTLGQHVDMLTPHQVLSVLEVRGHRWLTGGKLIRYQALLMDILDITLKVCQTLNLVTILSLVESGDLLPEL